MKQYFFAVDLGATSGRTIIGTLENGKLTQEEISRFDNRLIETGGHFYWDLFVLYNEIMNGLKICALRKLDITSIGIDTWGVDFVFIGSDGAILRNPLSYRDPHTFRHMDEYFEKVMDKNTVYGITGIQFMFFNSLFQFYAMRQDGNSAMEHAEKVLFLPDALSFMLTGKMVCEYTIASTSQMLHPRKGDLDDRMLKSVGLRREQFGPMVQPGTPIGFLSEEVQRQTGLGPVPVIAVAGHDTASAVAAVPARNRQFAYLSSGTWSLMGIENKCAIINDKSYEHNFTNEGGVEGTTRFLKNICGMWLYESCRREWKQWKESGGNGLMEVGDLSHQALQASAMESEPFRSIINPDDQVFANPLSMVEAIQDFCRRTGQPVPETTAQMCRCIFDSLALRYRQVFEWLKEFAPFPIDVLHIIGGGSLNKYLNQMTADSLGVEVLAGPQEGTAIGNIMLQAKAAGLVSDIWEMRAIIADSIDLVPFHPSSDRAAWDAAFSKFLVASGK